MGRAPRVGGERSDVQYARGVLALWSGRLDEAERFLAPLVDGRSRPRA